MADIFSESYMLEKLMPCVPAGETLAAGIHGVILQVNQKRTSYLDVYIGVTERSLLVAECEERKFLNPQYRIRDTRKAVEEELGVCFPASAIERCQVKAAWMGAVNCAVTLRDGGFLKLQLPKRGGLGGGMPRHAEYREAILTWLRKLDI